MCKEHFFGKIALIVTKKFRIDFTTRRLKQLQYCLQTKDGLTLIHFEYDGLPYFFHLQTLRYHPTIGISPRKIYIPLLKNYNFFETATSSYSAGATAAATASTSRATTPTDRHSSNFSSPPNRPIIGHCSHVIRASRENDRCGELVNEQPRRCRSSCAPASWGRHEHARGQIYAYRRKRDQLANTSAIGGCKRLGCGDAELPCHRWTEGQCAHDGLDQSWG